MKNGYLLALLLTACSLDTNGTEDGGAPDPNCVELTAADGGTLSACAHVVQGGAVSDAALNGPYLFCQSQCDNGCCTLDGVCHPGTETSLCGLYGQRCIDCAVYSATCGADGMCAP
jgi:hypothetical protein